MFSLNKIFLDSFHSGVLAVIYFLPVKTGGRKKSHIIFLWQWWADAWALPVVRFCICSGRSILNHMPSFCSSFFLQFPILSSNINLLILWTVVAVANLKASSDVPNLLVFQCVSA